MILSVVIPVFNEVQSLPVILAKVVAALPDVEKQIIVVDDYSTDGTGDWLERTIGQGSRRLTVGDRGQMIVLDVQGGEGGSGGCASASIQVVFHEKNRGKGAALRSGLGLCSGSVIVIQDADLEYDPDDWSRFWPLFERDVADVVFGSRLVSSYPHRCMYYNHYLANRVISFLFSVLYNQILSDLEVCYKMFRREVLPVLTLRSDDFGFEIEFSANVALHRHLRIYEVGISYYGRTYAEGKKIDWKDGLKALWYLIRFRVT